MNVQIFKYFNRETDPKKLGPEDKFIPLPVYTPPQNLSSFDPSEWCFNIRQMQIHAFWILNTNSELDFAWILGSFRVTVKGKNKYQITWMWENKFNEDNLGIWWNPWPEDSISISVECTIMYITIWTSKAALFFFNFCCFLDTVCVWTNKLVVTSCHSYTYCTVNTADWTSHCNFQI